MHGTAERYARAIDDMLLPFKIILQSLDYHVVCRSRRETLVKLFI